MTGVFCAYNTNAITKMVIANKNIMKKVGILFMRSNYKKRKNTTVVDKPRNTYYRVAGYYYDSDDLTEFGIFKSKDEAKEMFWKMISECEFIDIFRYVDGEIDDSWDYHADIYDIDLGWLIENGYKDEAIQFFVYNYETSVNKRGDIIANIYTIEEDIDMFGSYIIREFSQHLITTNTDF